MHNFNVQWSPTKIDRLPQERYAHMFALVSGGEVLYIGKAYRADLPELIPACIAGHDLDHLPLTIYLGRIREVGTGRISFANVDAIVDLLVFARKPRLNHDGKYNYAGADDLHLANDGCAVIPHRLRAENRLVFVAKPLVAAAV